MTPTRSQLDEALPPVPSGISALGGDLTEPDEPGGDRATALDWLGKFYAEAHKISRKQALTEITEIAARVGADEEAASESEPPKRRDPNALSCAIIEALGLDPNKVRGVRYEHNIPDLPTASLDVIALSDDLPHFDTIEQKWVLANELQHCDSGLDAVLPAGNPESGPEVPRNETRTYSASEHRDPHEVLDGDTWLVRNGRAVIVGSNDWPAPAKRTHESHLGYDWTSQGSSMLDPCDDDVNGRGGWKEYCHAADWSRTPDPQEAK